MLKHTTILTLIILIIVTSFSVYHVLTEPKIKPKMQQEMKASKKTTYYPTKQIRNSVQKDLWISNYDCRLHHRIISPRSILTTYPKDTHFELVEKMQGMKCYLQEKIETEGKMMQQIRFIESESGTYRYLDQHFDAHQVFLAIFRIPGNTLKTHLDFNTAFLKGVAQEVSLSFTEHSPHFHAEKFKAHIHPNN